MGLALIAVEGTYQFQPAIIILCVAYLKLSDRRCPELTETLFCVYYSMKGKYPQMRMILSPQWE